MISDNGNVPKLLLMISRYTVYKLSGVPPNTFLSRALINHSFINFLFSAWPPLLNISLPILFLFNKLAYEIIALYAVNVLSLKPNEAINSTAVYKDLAILSHSCSIKFMFALEKLSTLNLISAISAKTKHDFKTKSLLILKPGLILLT